MGKVRRKVPCDRHGRLVRVRMTPEVRALFQQLQNSPQLSQAAIGDVLPHIVERMENEQKTGETQTQAEGEGVRAEESELPEEPGDPESA